MMMREVSGCSRRKLVSCSSRPLPSCPAETEKNRHQPDQRLHLFRNEETLAWELERVETELWKSPPEPLLEQISAFLSLDRKEWMGTPTELAALLGVDMKPNALTRRLNVNAGRLLNEYGIRYESSRSHSERTVKLTADQA